MTSPAQALLIAAVALMPMRQAVVRTGTEPFNGRLYASVSQWIPEAPLRADDPARVPSTLRPRFERVVRCLGTFRSRLPDATEFFANSALPRRRALERALACLVDAPGIAEVAADYAAGARILYEWEGLSSSPLEEAAYAEKYISEHPQAPVRAYLYFFVAERARFAFEYFDAEKNPAGMAGAAAKYRTFLDQAQKADPIVALLANDLDGIAFVTRTVGKHPRDY